MNAEIYFPRSGNAFAQTAEKSFERTVKKLNEQDINIIYKTEVDLDEKSIRDALRVTESGEDKIGLIMIADVLDEDDSSKAQVFFESIGVLGKVTKIEARCKDPEEEAEAVSDAKTAAAEPKDKKKKKRNSKELIDISEGILTIEKPLAYAYKAEYNNKLIVLLPRSSA